MTDILTIPGAVIRHIPQTSQSLFTYREGRELRGELVEMDGRKFDKVIKQNSLGGKYVFTIQNDQMSQVHFNMKRDGVGDTPEGAYADYMKKRSQ